MSFPAYELYQHSEAEWLGDIPSHWSVKKLKYACTNQPSNVDKKTVEGEQPVRLCNYTDVYYNDEITADMALMEASATDEQIEKLTLQAGDVIITKDSESADDIAVSTYVPEDLPGIVCGYHLAIIRPREDVCGKFIKRLFDSVYIQSKVAILANGLTRVGLSHSAVSGLEIPMPPLDEQKAISSFLDVETSKIDGLVSEQRRLIELLKEKRQAVISHAVTKGLNPNAPMKPSGVDWIGETPTHWEVRKFCTLANVVRGSSPRPAGDPKLFNGDFMPWVTVAEITKDNLKVLNETETFLTELGAENSRAFEPNTLLYSNSGATLGVPKILKIQACANDGVIGFLELCDDADISFLYYFLYSITDAIREKVKQGSGQPNLNTDIVKGLKVPFPPLHEHTEIVEYLETRLETFSELQAEAERAIELLQERRTALISAAVTGKIDVRGFSARKAA